MKRQDAIALRAELEHITNDVRDLEVSPSRAAALQCLADAMMHLGRIKPIQTSPFPSVALASSDSWEQRMKSRPLPESLMPQVRVTLDSVPPSCAENARVRSEATRSFQKSRELLRKANDALKGIAR